MKNFGVTAGLTALLAAGSANAAVLYDSNINPAAKYDNVSAPASGRFGGPLGDSFFIPAGESWNISDVKADLWNGSNFANDPGSVLLYLVPDVGGAPSHSGLTLSGASMIGKVANNTLPFGATNGLTTIATNGFVTGGALGTRYWLEFVSSTDTNNCGLVSALNCTTDTGGNLSKPKLGMTFAVGGAPGSTGTLGEFSSGGLYSDTNNTILVDNIITWSNSAFHLDNIDNHSGAVTDFIVTIDAQTPEPASMAILGAGLVGLGMARRRARKNAK